MVKNSNQGIVISYLYTIPCMTKVGLENARDVRFLLSANVQWIYTIFIFHFNEEHVLFKQIKERSSVIGSI